MITQNDGPVEENTVGFEDDHEALQAELTAREVGRDARRQMAHASRVAKNDPRVSTGAARYHNGSPAGGIRGASGLGEEDLAESQEHWFVPQEGGVDAEPLAEGAEGLDGVCMVGEDPTEESQEE